MCRHLTENCSKAPLNDNEPCSIYMCRHCLRRTLCHYCPEFIRNGQGEACLSLALLDQYRQKHRARILVDARLIPVLMDIDMPDIIDILRYGTVIDMERDEVPLRLEAMASAMQGQYLH